MDDDGDSKVVDLQAQRIRRDAAAGEDAWRRGEAFRLLSFEREDIDAVGIGEDGAVVVLTNPHTAEGITMDYRTAHALGAALIACAEQARIASDPEARPVLEWLKGIE